MVGHWRELLLTRKIAKKVPKPIPRRSNGSDGKEIQEDNEKRITERNGVGMFLALADDECHETRFQ